MKILITIGLWGRPYAKLFTEYALASQLAEGNIPALAAEHEVTYHLVTTRDDAKWLRSQPALEELKKHAQIDWDYIEKHGYDPLLIPTGPEGSKYTFLSLLQNLAFEKSLKGYDALIFNYADFIWADGSLTNAVDMLGDNSDAVLTFCLPVDRTQAMARLDDVRAESASGGPALALPPRTTASIAIDCLHREAQLRYWDDPPFTITPTYLLWRAGEEGIVIRAYHQTILVMRVRQDDPDYRAGITFGSLDGHFTTLLADRENSSHATNSDEVLVFSLYDTIVESQIGGPSRHNWDGFDRDASLRDCLRNVTSPSQRKFALIPIEVRRDYSEPSTWEQAEANSLEVVESFHETSPFDAEEYDQLHRADTSLTDSAARWKQTINRRLGRASLRVRQVFFHRPRSLAYGYLLRALRGSTGQAIKRILGPSVARGLRLRFERAVFGSQSGGSAPLTDLSLLTKLPTAEEACPYLEAGLVTPLTETIGRFMHPVTPVPNLQLSVWAQASLHAGLYSEQVLNEVADLYTLNRILSGAEITFRAAVSAAPLWPETHRALGRNLWFQGRHAEAIEAFQAGEDCLSGLADTAGWPPDDHVMLPRNCAHVIGLMGHLDAFVKYKRLTDDRREYCLLVRDDEVVNTAFLDYWRDHIKIVSPEENPLLAERELAYAANWNWVLPTRDRSLVHVHRGISRIQCEWQEKFGRRPLLTLTDEHESLLAYQKEKWGMSPADKYVCLHVRSAGYYADKERTAQDFRNTPIEDYYGLIRAVTDAGYFVVRMGEQTSPELDLEAIGGNTGRIIDYAHEDDRSPDLDVALSAGCELFVSSPSGLHTVAHAFGRPVCYVNFPVYAGFPWHPGELLCPQHYYSHRLGRELTLEELLSSDLVRADHKFLFDGHEVELRKNSADDITETVREALGLAEYPKSEKNLGLAVRAEFARLSNEHDLDISGQLALRFAWVHAGTLCPDVTVSN